MHAPFYPRFCGARLDIEWELTSVRKLQTSLMLTPSLLVFLILCVEARFVVSVL